MSSNYDCNYDCNNNIFVKTILKPINLPSIVNNIDYKDRNYSYLQL